MKVGYKGCNIMVCPPVQEVIHCLKRVGFLLVQADKLWYNYYIQSTLVISKSKGSSKTVRDIRTSTYQICSIEEKTI